MVNMGVMDRFGWGFKVFVSIIKIDEKYEDYV